jgi:hypothetical protein
MFRLFPYIGLGLLGISFFYIIIYNFLNPPFMILNIVGCYWIKSF